MEDTQQQQQKDQAAGETAKVKQFDQRTPNDHIGVEPGPTSADVTANAEAFQSHVDEAKANLSDVVSQVHESGAGEHTGLRGALDKMGGTLENLAKHAAHVVGIAKKAETAPAAAATTAPKSTATSDAHLNRGNGGAVTGNPGASFKQASAAQAAVEQGAPLPGVATVPQPDAAVR